MDNLYLSFLMITIFALYGYSYPTHETRLFEYVDGITEKCPIQNHSILFNKHSEYLSKCTDVVLNNAPKSIDILNLKNFLCVGVFEADVRLCNALSDTNYSNLPSTDAVLEQEIARLEIKKPDKICKKFKTIYSNLTDIKPQELLPWMSVLNESLTGPLCVHLCSDMSQKYTNVLCLMLYYINDQIEKVITSKQQVPLVEKTTEVEPSQNTNKAEGTTTTQYLYARKHLPVLDLPNVQDLPHNVLRGVAKHLGTLETGRETSNLNPQKNEIKIRNPNATFIAHIDSQMSVLKIDATKTNSPKIDQNKVSPTPQPATTQQELVDPSVIPSTTQSIPSTIFPKQTNVTTVVKTVEETPQLAEIKSEISLPKVAEETPLPKVTNANKGHDIFDLPDTSVKEILDPNLQQTEYDDDDDDVSPIAEKNEEAVRIRPVDASANVRHFEEVEDSNFFSYFMFISVLFIFGYVVYHNKQKILALLLEGRRERNSRRRPSTSSYRKLNSNLEEAVTSKCSGSASHVIY